MDIDRENQPEEKFGGFEWSIEAAAAAADNQRIGETLLEDKSPFVEPSLSDLGSLLLPGNCNLSARITTVSLRPEPTHTHTHTKKISIPQKLWPANI